MKKLNKAGPRGAPCLPVFILESGCYLWCLFLVQEVSFMPVHLDRSFCIILDTEPCPKLLENSNTLVSSGSTLPCVCWHCYRAVAVWEMNFVLQKPCWYSQYTLSMCLMILFISINSFSCLAQGGSQTYIVLSKCGVERYCCYELFASVSWTRTVTSSQTNETANKAYT